MIAALLALSTTTSAFVLTSPPAKSPTHRDRTSSDPTMIFEVDMATRRKVLPVAFFGLLGSRVAILASTKETFTPPDVATFEPDVAMEASRAAGACPVQSCNTARLLEMQYALDTSKVAKNAKGSAATHMPIVWVDVERVDAARPYSAKVVMVAPESSGDTVKLMWLVNAATGQIIGSKTIQAASTQMGVVSGAPVQGATDGPATLVAGVRERYAGVERGTKVQPYVLYANDGLWAGEPFVLTEASPCPGALGPADFVLDTRGRRPRGELGAELQRKAAGLKA